MKKLFLIALCSTNMLIADDIDSDEGGYEFIGDCQLFYTSERRWLLILDGYYWLDIEIKGVIDDHH